MERNVTGNGNARRMDVPARVQRALEEMATNEAIESLVLLHEARLIEGRRVRTRITIARLGGVTAPGRADGGYTWGAEDTEEVGPSAVRCHSVDQPDRDYPTPRSAYQAALTALYALAPVPGCLEHQ